MKKHHFQLISAIFISILLSACSKTSTDSKTGNKEETKSNTEQNSTSASGEVTEVKLPTMQCGTCKKNIEKAVKKVDGVIDVNVSVKDKKAKVSYDKSKTDLSKIEGAIVMAGYQANDKEGDKAAYDKLEDCCKIGGHDK